MNKTRVILLTMAIFAGVAAAQTAKPKPAAKPASAPAPAAGKTVTLADKGLTKAMVVVAADAHPAEQKAADELVKYLSQVTGARFQLARPPSSSRMRILVGLKAARVAMRPQTDDLTGDGIIIRSVGTDIVILGKTPHGTLNAAYTFLEDFVGCRWYTPSFGRIPKKPTLTIEPINVHYNPVFEQREPYFPPSTSDAEWSLCNKCNGQSNGRDPKLGGKVLYAGFVHTFNQLIPPAKYFKAHPEWFAMIGGKRMEKEQLCLTNEEMRRELVKNLKALLKKNPDAMIASVSQNDLQRACQCEKCAAVDAAEESPSGNVLNFVNAVADDIKPAFPKVYIDTLAYMYTRKPPKTVRPRDNVIIRYCTIYAAMNKPLTDPANAEFDQDLSGWGKICNRIYVWDYVSTFYTVMLPSQNMSMLAPNVRYFAAHNVKGVFEEGSSQKGAHLAELKAWVLAKLLWDPNLDQKKLIDEFVQAYYGPAAKDVTEYIDAFTKAADECLESIHCFPKWKAPHITIETMTTAWQKVQAAKKAAADMPMVLERVEMLEMSTICTWLMNWVQMHQQAEELMIDWPVKESPQELYDRFMELAKKHDVKALDEIRPERALTDLDEALKRAKAYKAPTTKKA